MGQVNNQYLSRIRSVRYIFKDGSCASFVNFKYFTSNESEIEQLNAAVAAKHPTFYVDPDNITVDIDTLDPVEQIGL